MVILSIILRAYWLKILPIIKFSISIGVLLLAGSCVATPITGSTESKLSILNDDPAAMLSDEALGLPGNGQPLEIVTAVESTDVNGNFISRLVRRQRDPNRWEAHAKYYAFGGKRGNEVYASGTWTKPVLDVGQNSGPCDSRIGPLGTPTNPSDIINKSCSCSIVTVGPLRFKSRCNQRWVIGDNDGEYTLAFNLAFECTAFYSCTGTNAYKISAAQSSCRDLQNKGHCTGFRVTS
ncbi:hypothetical protein KVT40_002096 [Elsinoe batatas]|uniref:Uncharacterized protein n=1 Tax=Elsinoe batatas TaxID=2601811 RepID=A0A8K0L7Q8_9PEZI|nr:hypothetical protein KVT40_002096 [Elsinoe batatas]